MLSVTLPREFAVRSCDEQAVACDRSVDGTWLANWVGGGRMFLAEGGQSGGWAERREDAAERREDAAEQQQSSRSAADQMHLRRCKVNWGCGGEIHRVVATTVRCIDVTTVFCIVDVRSCGSLHRRDCIDRSAASTSGSRHWTVGTAAQVSAGSARYF